MIMVSRRAGRPQSVRRVVNRTRASTRKEVRNCKKSKDSACDSQSETEGVKKRHEAGEGKRKKRGE